MEGNNLLDSISDDIIKVILIHSEINDLGNVSQVCRLWALLVRQQDFWRSFAITFFGNDIVPLKIISPTGTLLRDTTQYLVPTISNGQLKHIDWRQYCKVRHRLRNFIIPLSIHFDPSLEKCHEYKGYPDSHTHTDDYADEIDFEFDLKEDLIAENFKYWLEILEHPDFTWDYPNRLPRVFIALFHEIVPLLVQENRKELIEQFVDVFSGPLEHIEDYKKLRESLATQSMEIFQALKSLSSTDKARQCMLKHIFELCKQCLTWKENFSFAKQFLRKTLREKVELDYYFSAQQSNGSDVEKSSSADVSEDQNTTIEHISNVDSNKNSNENDELIFYNVFYLTIGINRQTLLIEYSEGSKVYEPSIKILCDFISAEYFKTDDFSKKTVIIELCKLTDGVNAKAVTPEKLMDVACDAAQKYEKCPKLSFAGYALMQRLFSQRATWDISLEKALQFFDILSDGIKRFPESGLYFVIAVERVIHMVVESQIDDDRLERLNMNFISLLRNPKKVIHKVVKARALWPLNFGQNLSTFFGARMRKYLPMYKEALIEVANSQELRIDPATGKPFVSRAQILFLYYALARDALDEEFNDEAENFTNAVINNSLGYELSSEDISEFNLLACDTAYRLIKHDSERVARFIRDLLADFDPRIAEYGKSFVSEGRNFDEIAPKYVPMTWKDFETSVRQFDRRKNSWIRKRSSVISENFTYRDAWEHLMESYDDNPDIEEADILEARKKYTPTNVNPTWLHEDMYLGQIKQLRKPQHISVITLLMDILAGSDAQKFLEFAPTTLHVILAFIRLTYMCSYQYYDGAIKIYKLMEPNLAPVDRRYYMQILGRIVEKRVKVVGHDAGLFPYFRTIHEIVLDCAEKYRESSPSLINGQLLVAIKIAGQEFYEPNSKLLYGAFKRALAASPRKTYASIMGSDFMKTLHALDKARLEEKTLIMASIGYHFGINFLRTLIGYTYDSSKDEKVLDSVNAKKPKSVINIHFQLNQCRQNCIELSRAAKKRERRDTEEIDILERFLILLEVHGIDEDLCVFNSRFSELEADFLSAIHNEKFSTGNEDLNERAKKFTSLGEFFKTSAYVQQDQNSSKKSYCSML